MVRLKHGKTNDKFQKDDLNSTICQINIKE